MGKPTCSVTGCDREVKTRGWCEAHYFRVRRHGSTDDHSPPGNTRSVQSHGYILLHGYHGHPVADGRGAVYEHRLVLWDKLGGRDAPCHWCARPVRWSVDRYHGDKLQADHLGAKDDNRPEMLVPSCRACNNDRYSRSESVVKRAARTRTTAARVLAGLASRGSRIDPPSDDLWESLDLWAA